MSNKPREGDKYVIEIQSLYGTFQTNTLRGDRPETGIAKTTLFRIKGFPSVVFTEEDLLKLDKYEEQPEEPEIKVGDEVRSVDGKRVAVTRVFWEDGQIWFEGVNGKGEICGGNVSDAEPTGRKVPGITKALEFIRADIGK